MDTMKITMKEIAKKFEDIGFPVESSRELTTEDGIITYPSITFPRMALDCKCLLPDAVKRAYSTRRHVIPYAYDYDLASPTSMTYGGSKITLSMETFNPRKNKYCDVLDVKYATFTSRMLEILDRIVSTPEYKAVDIKEMARLPILLGEKIANENTQFLLSAKSLMTTKVSPSDNNTSDLVRLCRIIAVRDEIEEAFDTIRFQLDTKTLQDLLKGPVIVGQLCNSVQVAINDKAEKVILKTDLRKIM